MTRLRVLVADDHEVVRRGVCALIGTHPEWSVCGEAASGREVIDKVRTLAPDLVILDVSMRGQSGLETIRRIRKVAPGTEVLILTMRDSDQMVRDLLAAGARGYLVKSDAGRELVNAVEALSRHQPFFTGRIAEKMLDAYLESGRRSDGRLPEGDLSAREREVVHLLAEGRTNKEVAGLLGITLKTAENHRTHIMRKLHLKGIGELVRFAIRNRLTEP